MRSSVRRVFRFGGEEGVDSGQGGCWGMKSGEKGRGGFDGGRQDEDVDGRVCVVNDG